MKTSPQHTRHGRRIIEAEPGIWIYADTGALVPIPDSFADHMADIRVELQAIEATVTRQHGKPVVATVMWVGRAIVWAQDAWRWVRGRR